MGGNSSCDCCQAEVEPSASLVAQTSLLPTPPSGQGAKGKVAEPVAEDWQGRHGPTTLTTMEGKLQMELASGGAMKARTAPQEVRAMLTKHEHQILGLRIFWGPQTEYIEVRGVEPLGAIAEWNEANPEKQVVGNSIIVSVNGLTDCVTAAAELKSASTLDICFRRLPPPTLAATVDAA
mmetsp:Transcript_20365/g.37046  ORF Transcript_20365/g.37046 Transcript_20365/m.37046 type:complete len:179 (-) Transcript_20365:23-559(-)